MQSSQPESLFVELAKQIPALVVLAWLVWWFLRHLRDVMLAQRQDIAAITREHASRLEEILESRAAMLERVIAALDRSSLLHEKVLTRIEVIGRCPLEDETARNPRRRT